uniref:Uncharacterized protein n=1 Tax=Cannabis sativa TaxID=3483 RepID=A0A803PG52_CANSA
MVVVNTMTQLINLVRIKPQPSEFSLWHSLWKDLFSKVFRSIRSIISVLSAFVASCNRHRLSIYNYLRVILRKLSNRLGFSSANCSCCRSPQSNIHVKNFQTTAIPATNIILSMSFELKKDDFVEGDSAVFNGLPVILEDNFDKNRDMGLAFFESGTKQS